MPRDNLRLGLSGATFLAHFAVANRYDFFRDELYFIICGRHPSFGYADQPPLVPLLSALTQAFGEHLFLLRALSCLAAAATVHVTISLARLVGAGTYGAALAGLSAAIAPMYLGLMTTVGTTTFEPFFWTLIAYLAARALREENPQLWLWAGLAIGVDLEIKYQLPIYLVPLLAALLLTGQARALRCWQVGAGAAIAAALAAPSLIWQLTHQLPFLEMLGNQAREGKNVVLAPLDFLGQQVLVMNPLLLPVWLAGIAAPFLQRRFRQERFLSLAFLFSFAAMMAMHAKDYYLGPLYGAMFALGGAALETALRPRWLRAIHLASALAVSAAIAPLAMPILSPPALVAHMQRLHLQSKSSETVRQGALPQTFADMFGWRELTRSVTGAVQKLPVEEQRRVVILAHNYGEAAALEFYGHDLPPVLAGHNQYYLWGLKGTQPDELIAFNREPQELRDNCAETRVLTRYFADWVMPFENDSAITLCRGIHPPLAELWPKVKLFY